MHKVRVLIADDHALIRCAFRALLSAQPDIEVAGEADDGVVVVEQSRRMQPDVVLLDLSMPGRGGIGAIQEILQVSPATRVLVVSMHDEDTYARQAMLAGASGYVLKRASAEELLSAIRSVSNGHRHIPASLAQAGLENVTNSQPGNSLVDRLTPREKEVVGLVALGHTNAEIARRLCISDKTVETHRLHIMTKLALRSRADLVRFALEYKLISN
jgi:two-component system response regulator NreC